MRKIFVETHSNTNLMFFAVNGIWSSTVVTFCQKLVQILRLRPPSICKFKYICTPPNQKFIVVATSRMIGIPRSSVDGHRRPSSAFQLFPMPEVPLSRCWPSSEMPGILCFKIVGIPIKACAAQLSFNVFPLTNQYWHH